jgi:hypothetical protein
MTLRRVNASFFRTVLPFPAMAGVAMNAHEQEAFTTSSAPRDDLESEGKTMRCVLLCEGSEIPSSSAEGFGTPSGLWGASRLVHHRSRLPNNCRPTTHRRRANHNNSNISYYPRKYDLEVVPEQENKACEIRLGSFRRPHMRAFHFAWFGLFVSIPSSRPTSARPFASADVLRGRTGVAGRNSSRGRAALRRARASRPVRGAAVPWQRPRRPRGGGPIARGPRGAAVLRGRHLRDSRLGVQDVRQGNRRDRQRAGRQAGRLGSRYVVPAVRLLSARPFRSTPAPSHIRDYFHFIRSLNTSLSKAWRTSSW